MDNSDWTDLEEIYDMEVISMAARSAYTNHYTSTIVCGALVGIFLICLTMYLIASALLGV